MRLKLVFKLENPKLDIQYRKGIISWIKHAIQTYDENLFQEIYHANQKKTFTFAPILSAPQFEKEEIIMKDNQFSILFSAYNYSHALHLYNSFLGQKFKKFSLFQNSMTLIQLIMIPEKEIVTEKITIKMASPLVVRNHNRETLKDMYYAYDREEFKKYLYINIEEQLQAENLDKHLLEKFDINPVQAKKIVIPVYEKMLECSIGIFQLEGKIELLDYLYKAGFGAKKAMGFGVFEIC
ncbi:MAG: CRISPR-associated endoribonuclease Cas6 [Clostridia bacterium]